jgi:hypothetical protein
MSVPAIPAIDKLENILASSENFLQRMHELGAEPHQRKTMHRLFSPSEAAEMVGRDRTTLGRAESEIGIQSPPRNPGNNRRVGYTLAQIQAFPSTFTPSPGATRPPICTVGGRLPELQRWGR